MMTSGRYERRDFAWSVKADLAEPLFYAALAAVLLAARLWPRIRRAGQIHGNYATLPRSKKPEGDAPSGPGDRTTEDL